MKININKFQWSQLFGLAVVHFVADTFPGIVPAVLPAVREHFDLTLTQGFSLVTTLYFCCNVSQVLLGHLRSDNKKPLLLPLGILFACLICLLGLIPDFSLSFALLLLVMVVGGFGVGLVHPESLRVLHNLRRIKSGWGTAIYLNSGFAGFMIGSLIGAVLVYRLGLNGLLVMLLPVGLSFFLLLKLPMRLSIERTGRLDNTYSGRQVSFWLLFIMAAPVAISSTLIPAMLPSALNELGFKLYFGGIPGLLIGVGSILGSLFWAWSAERYGYLKACCVSAFFAVPFTIAYMLLMGKASAVILLLGTGFGAQGAYVLLVSMARHSKGMVLGRRMGFIVGGVWGLASLVLLAAGPIAEKVGLTTVLHFTPYGYMLSAIIALVLLIKKRIK